MSNNTYNQIPYISKPFFKTHPAYLKSTLALCDIETPPLKNAKVLEIGCSMGGNIIPLAINYPDMQLVGIDLSPVQIEKGNQIIQSLDLKNIIFISADITNVECEEGLFDYIICHGVFSWVPAHVQSGILKFIQKALSPNGVAFISYNTYPGWHTSIAYRDLAMLQDIPEESAEIRYQTMMDSFNFLYNTLPESTALGTALKNDYASLTQHPAYYMLHEYLEPCNCPLYFNQFNDMLKENQLTHLVDADFMSQFMPPSHLNSSQVAQLKALAKGDVIHEEQLKDFVNNRHFRQSIITKAANLSNMQRNPGEWLKLHIAADIQQKVDANGNVHYYSGNEEFTDNPTIQFIVSHLSQSKLATIPIIDLYQKYLNTMPENDEFFSSLTQLAGQGYVILRPHAITLYNQIDEKPTVIPAYRGLAKHLLHHTDINAATIYHQNIEPTFLENYIMMLCDGTHTQEDLKDILMEKVATGELKVTLGTENALKNTSQSLDEVELCQYFKEQISATLAFCAKYGLFIAPQNLSHNPKTSSKENNKNKKNKKGKATAPKRTFGKTTKKKK